jgi:hypothetical protein
METKGKRVVLAQRPSGWVQRENFRVEDFVLPEPKAGEILVRNHLLSLDPYMRARMDDAPSYAAPVQIGEPMVGATVGEVLASGDKRFSPGEWVSGFLGWQTHAVVKPGTPLNKVDLVRAPKSAYLSILGMTGVTAWMGLTQIRPPKSGQTFVVSAASGAVGSIAGQIAKIMGAKVIGIAGGPEKCDYVVSELGFDACVDYRSPNFVKDLAGATPAGVDFNFENVGGPVMEAVVARLNPFATVALCGLISQYNANRPAGLAAISTILAQRVRMEGFIVADRLDLWPRALTEIADWYSKGLLKQGRETVAQGIEAAPEAFIGLLRGDNFGKQLVGLV